MPSVQPSSLRVDIDQAGKPGRSAPHGAALWPLRLLLHYVKPHCKYAVCTALFGSAGFLLSFVYPWVIGEVVDLLAQGGEPNRVREARLWQLVQIAALSSVAHGVVIYGRGHYNTVLGSGIVTDLRRDLFDHLQRLSVRFYAQQQVGAILARVLHDVREATSIIYVGILVAALDAMQLTLALALLWSLSAKLTIACLLVFPLYGLLFACANPRVRAASERVSAKLAQISGDLTERLAGQALIKTYAAERREAERFRSDIDEHHRRVTEESKQGHRVAGASEFLVELGTAIVIGYGGWLALRGELSAGMLTRFLGYVIILYGPVRRFAELNITYQSSLSAMRRIFRLLAVQPGVVERPLPHLVPPSQGHVRFENVRFSYAEQCIEELGDDAGGGPLEAAHEAVLHDLNLEVAPGERVAIVGPSGAGKTTLVSLLPRLYDVSHGRIVIDGVDVRDYALHALRSAIGIVQQDSFVFTGSIRDNIAYGLPGASDAQIEAAAKAAHAHEFICKLPQGYAARLGERGVNLSGGQRQRISIARALLKDPKILILDEATSSLDAESEHLVHEALERLMKGRTCFIIAHRLSTVRDMERILVLDRGRIVESGSHAQLLARGNVYARLVRMQAVLG
jgi:ABC-type multidrug transport system fused ATPase/permease subunit